MILNKDNKLHMNLLLLISVSVAFLFYHESVFELYNLWVVSANPAYSHGILLFPLAIFFIYKNIRNQSELTVKVSMLGFVLLFLMSYVWGGLYLAGIKVGHEFLFIVILYLIFWALFGFYPAITVALPVFLVVFAIPVWEVINQGDLQLVTAYMVRKLMELSGYLVYQNGVNLELDVGSFRVAENCSGMRQLLVAMPIAVLYTTVNRLKLSVVVFCFIAAILLAFVSNIIRIYIVVLAGQLTNMQHYFVKEDHVTLGWVVFTIVFLGSMLAFHKFTIRRQFQRAEVTKSDKATTIADASMPSESKGYIKPAILMLMSLLVGPLYAHLQLDRISAKDHHFDLGNVVSPWAAVDTKDKYIPYIKGDDWQYSNAYSDGYGTLNLKIYHYNLQRQNAEAVSRSNRIADEINWFKEKKSVYTFYFDENHYLDANEYVIRNQSGENRYVIYWYYVNNRHMANPLMAKLNAVLGAFKMNTQSTILVLSTKDPGNIDEARAWLTKFLYANFQIIDREIQSLHE